jgi:hypothetical protein
MMAVAVGAAIVEVPAILQAYDYPVQIYHLMWQYYRLEGFT